MANDPAHPSKTTPNTTKAVVKEYKGSLVRMNFEVPEDLRNAFKAKVAHKGKRVKDVFAVFMASYVENEG